MFGAVALALFVIDAPGAAQVSEVPNDDMAARFAAMDADSDGLVDRSEMRATIAAFIKEQAARRAERNNGVAMSLGDKQIDLMADRMFALLDSNRDGKLSLAEVRLGRDRMRVE